jgi:hypothetical protein
VYSFLWAVALLGLFTVGRGESFFSPLMLVLIPLSFMIGRGLLKLQQWARRGALVLSVLCILSSLPLPCYVCYELYFDPSLHRGAHHVWDRGEDYSAVGLPAAMLLSLISLPFVAFSGGTIRYLLRRDVKTCFGVA